MQSRTLQRTRGIALALLLGLLSAPSLAQETPSIIEVEGVNFATQLDIDGRSYEMLGSGLFTYMMWDAYVGAYYQASGFPRPSPLGDVPRQLVLEYFHAIAAEDFAKATREGVANNVDDAQMKSLSGPLHTFNESYRDVVPGDRYALTWTGAELRLSYNGDVLYHSDNQALASALFAIWLGENPAQESFKQALLGH